MGKRYIKSYPKSPTLLIFSPHPDDLELSTGLLCHKAVHLGWYIIEIVLTDGAGGGIDPSLFHTSELINTRMTEARTGASTLGINTVKFWGYDDSFLDKEECSLKRRVSMALHEFKPLVVVFPSVKDTHPDHSCTHRAVVSCLSREHHQIMQLQYCFWGDDDDQNLMLFHQDGVVKKVQAIKAHQSQPVDSYLSRKRYKDLPNLYAEMYFSPDPVHAVLVLRKLGFDIKPR